MGCKIIHFRPNIQEKMRKYVEDERKTQYLTNVWYMKCRKVGIVGVLKPPYLCTVEK